MRRNKILHLVVFFHQILDQQMDCLEGKTVFWLFPKINTFLYKPYRLNICLYCLHQIFNQWCLYKN